MKTVKEKFHFKTDSVLDGLSPDDIAVLKRNMQTREEKKARIIFREGTFSKGVYILRKGKVKIYQVNREGKEQIIYIYSKGEILGYRPLLCNETHPVSAAALEDCVLYFIPAKDFIEVTGRSVVLLKKLLVNLSYEFSVWANKISVFAQQPVLQRVCTSLLILNEKYKKENQPELPAVINLSREDLANYVGTTIETLVRTLRYLKDKKIIVATGRKITVMKPKELESIAEIN